MDTTFTTYCSNKKMYIKSLSTYLLTCNLCTRVKKTKKTSDKIYKFLHSKERNTHKGFNKH